MRKLIQNLHETTKHPKPRKFPMVCLWFPYAFLLRAHARRYVQKVRLIPGKGTKGTKEPKKLTKARRRYPTSDANGKRSTKSTNQTVFGPYLIKSRTKKDTIH